MKLHSFRRKYSLFLKLTFLCLVIAGASVLKAQTPDTTASTGGDTLVTNGDFSKATADPTWPDGWPKGPGITWESENGTHFIRLTAKEPGKQYSLYRPIPIPADTKSVDVTISYRLAGLVKGAQGWFDARTVFHFLDSAGKEVPPTPGAMVFSNQPEWTEVKAHFAVPTGATQLVIMPALFQVEAGTLDLAKISVMPGAN